MAGFVLHHEGEPRGEPYGEPRDDGLYLDEEEECWRNEDGQSVCGAHPKSRTWEYRRCRQTIKAKNGRCNDHGGQTPEGEAHGAFRHGKYSGALPDNLRAKYEEVREDEHLKDLREELAIIETRIHAALDSLDAEDSAQLWADINNEFRNFQAAREAGDAQAIAKSVNSLSRLIERGASVRSQWEEIGNLIERKRRLVDSERRREKALQAYVPYDQFMIQIRALSKVLREHIDDRKTLQAVIRDLKSVLSLD